MEIIRIIGIILIFIGIIFLVEANFGLYSQKVKKQRDELFEKENTNKNLTKIENYELRYWKIQKFFLKSWTWFLYLGLIVFAITYI